MGIAVKVIGWLALAALLAYLAVLGWLFCNQRALLFPAPTGADIHPDPAPGYREVFLTSADGTRLRAFYHLAPPGSPTILFFHGNAETLSGSEAIMAPFIAAGYGALLPEYRGYGGNPGHPGEHAFYADARAARGWLAKQGVTPARAVLFGYSLGTGIAAELAAEAPAAALVLVAPYSSIPHVAWQHYPYVPTNLLVLDRFDTRAKLTRVATPTLIIHGTADRTVPYDNGVALARAKPDATFVTVPGADHGVVTDPAAVRRMLAWMGATLRL